MIKRCVQLALVVLAMAALPAGAAEFRSVAENAVVLYDAPSAKAKKRYILGRGYPVEVVVVVEGWTKIRDAGGELAWIETRSAKVLRSAASTACTNAAASFPGDGSTSIFNSDMARCDPTSTRYSATPQDRNTSSTALG